MKKEKKRPKTAAPPAAASNNVPEVARNAGDKIWTDQRFAHLVSDPRFKNIAKSTRTVKIDKRFEAMFKDDKFNVKYTVDKRGRPTKQSTSDDLKRFYEMSSEDEDAEAVAAEQRREAQAITKDDDNDDDDEKPLDADDAADASDADEADVDADVAGQLGSDDDAAAIPRPMKDKLKDLSVDYARGESALCSDGDSSDDESSDDDGTGEELFIEHVWGELDQDAERRDDSTRRLAVCNMDWDRIRAQDIMVLCNSFLPPGGAILSVTIYPSEFGKERMAEEELKGPQELTEKTLPKKPTGGDSDDSDFDLGTDDEADNADDDDDDNTTARHEDEAEEGDDYNMEKLRQYQLNRLRYYYAVIECNSVEAADKIYRECDGMEYESTATKLDLRFVDDDTEFDGDEPKDRCTEMPDTSKYAPRLFTTTALQQAKVELTWDENDLDRKELNDKLAAGKLAEVADQDLRKYVAYSSEEEESEAEESVAAEEVLTKPAKKSKKTQQVAAETATTTEKKSKKSDAISKYKNLLAEINKSETEKKNNRIEMEFSWGIGMKEKPKKAAVDSDAEQSDGNDDDDDDANVDAKSKQRNPDQTHFDRIVELKREKKKQRKEERKAKRKKFSRSGGGAADDSGSEIGGAVGSDDDEDAFVPDGIDMNDPYFAEEFANGEFEAPKRQSKKDKKRQLKKRTEEEEAAEREQAAKLALLLDDADADGADKRAHFSLKQIQASENETKSKRKRRAVLKRSKRANEAEKAMLQADDFKIDAADDRFKEIYTSHLFSIDPTNPNFKKTKAMDTLIAEKLKRVPLAGSTKAAERQNGVRNGDADAAGGQPSPAKKPKKSAEVSMLVKSIKRKVAQQ